MGPFRWYEPEDVADACRYLACHAADARPVAGGTDLVIQMTLGRAAPRHVVNLARLADLGGIRHDGTDLYIGALTSVQEIERSALVQAQAPLLVEAARLVASPGIRAMATLGGNLCNASPSADLAPPLLVLEAEVRIVGPAHERRLPLAEFFLAPGRSALQPGELLAGVRVPDLPPATRGVYLKLPAKTMNDIALVGVAALARSDPGTRRITMLRLALGAVAPTPRRARASETLLAGCVATPANLDAAAAAAASEARPISDVRGSAAYRQAMVRSLARQALGAVTGSAGEDDG
jgi:carbon-monoxide dehydrogenase medium subunit